MTVCDGFDRQFLLNVNGVGLATAERLRVLPTNARVHVVVDPVP